MTSSTFKLPALNVLRDGGWADLEFRLLGHETQDEGAFHLFCAGAHYKGTPVAFNILFPTIWNFDPPRGAPRGVCAYSGAMALVNAQPLHRNFLETLAELWDVPAPLCGMANFTEVSAVTMQGDPELVFNERVSLKLLFGAPEGSPVPYGELYLTLDVPNRIVEIKEKDPEWRAAIIDALARGTVDRDVAA
jgi:hypothetical protein